MENVAALAQDNPLNFENDGEGGGGGIPWCICDNGNGASFMPKLNVCKKEPGSNVKKCGSPEKVKEGFSLVAYCSTEC